MADVKQSINVSSGGFIANQKYYFPIIYSIILAVLLYFAIGFAYRKIESQLSEIKSAQQEISTMSDKIAELKQFSSKYQYIYNSANIAIPPKSSILIVFNQIKQRANENQVLLEDIRLASQQGTEKTAELSQDTLSFTLRGELDNIINYFSALSKIAPLSLINTVQFNFESGGELSADIKLVTFWTFSIQQISPVTSPLSKISSEDMQALERTTALTEPSIRILFPSGPSDRINPFF